MDKRDKVVLVPLGSIEQHGPHCPVVVDRLLGGELAARVIEAIQLCEGRTIRGGAGGRPPSKPDSMEESLLRLQRLSEKWLALYESVDAEKPKERSATATAPTNAKRKLKDEVSEFFRSKERATRKFENQVAGLVEVLGDQAEELCKIVADAFRLVRDTVAHDARFSRGRRRLIFHLPITEDDSRDESTTAGADLSVDGIAGGDLGRAGVCGGR